MASTQEERKLVRQQEKYSLPEKNEFGLDKFPSLFETKEWTD